MQKKLYFLDEQEKNRILNLHENRTQGQYLLNEQTGDIPYPTDISKEAIDKILKVSADNKKGLRGSYLFLAQQQEIDKLFGKDTYAKFIKAGGESVLKGKKKFSAPKPSFANYKCVAGDIKDSKSYLGKKYIDKEYLDPNQFTSQTVLQFNMPKTNVYTYYDSGVFFYKIQNKRVPENEDTFYKYSCDGTKIVPTQEVVDIDGKKITTNEKKTGTNYQQVAGGYISSNLVTPEKMQQIRTTIGSQETNKTLSQTDINNLYTTLFNTLQKKQ